MEVNTIPWYFSNSIFLLDEIDEFVSQTTTQLSAHTVTPKLMDNEMKGNLSNSKFKSKTHANRCLTKNTLCTHTHLHGYKHKLKY